MSESAKMAPIYTFIFLFPGVTLHFVIIPTMEGLRGIVNPLGILGGSVDFYKYSSNPSMISSSDETYVQALVFLTLK